MVHKFYLLALCAKIEAIIIIIDIVTVQYFYFVGISLFPFSRGFDLRTTLLIDLCAQYTIVAWSGGRSSKPGHIEMSSEFIRMLGLDTQFPVNVSSNSFARSHL